MSFATEFLSTPLIRPTWEISAYEALWEKFGTVPRMANLFREYNHQLPSVVANAEGFAKEAIECMKSKLAELMPWSSFSATFYGDFEYPNELQDAKNPIEILYYRGSLDLLSSNSIAVVGSRKPSENGLKRARKLAWLLAKNDFTVMSGCAAGIDTAAHQAAVDAGGKTIGVIGTSLNHFYPKQNSALQNEIARNHLLVSQVPFYFSSKRDYRINRGFFPERNKTMSALSQATVIIEASETSGTLIQARAALAQGRKLFILQSCFEQGLKWPENYLKKGAIKLHDVSQILDHVTEKQIEISEL